MVLLDAMQSAPLPAAPGQDAHVSLDLANSAVDMPQVGTAELLTSPEAATAWLIDRGLADEQAGLQEYCAGLLKGLRSHVRELFEAAVTDAAPEPAALKALNAALSKAPAAELLGWDEVHGFGKRSVAPVTRVVEHAMTQIAADAVQLLSGPEVATLAKCEARPCNRFFLRTHARRQWCSKRCGDRVRAARLYQRQRDSADAPQS